MKRSRELCGHADSNDGDDRKERPGEPDESSPAAKLSHRDPAVDDYQTEDNVKMTCWLPPHHAPLTFGSYREYESHYNLSHLNKCLECHKTFPSEHLLGIHIEEIHDPLVRVRRDNGEHTVSGRLTFSQTVSYSRKARTDLRCSTPALWMIVIANASPPKNADFT